MKNKLLNLLCIIGVCAFATACLLVAVDLVSFGTLWLDYLFLGSLLIIFVCLNFKFHKSTEYDETLSCLRRAKKSLSSVKTDKELNYVKLLAVQNQLANASIYLSELTASFDLYELKQAVNDLENIRSHYRSDDDFRLTVKAETKAEDTAVLERIIASVKEAGKSEK